MSKQASNKPLTRFKVEHLLGVKATQRLVGTGHAEANFVAGSVTANLEVTKPSAWKHPDRPERQRDYSADDIFCLGLEESHQQRYFPPGILDRVVVRA